MRRIKRKTLIVSLGYEGGCLYYANSIVKNLTNKCNFDLWVSSSSVDIPFEAVYKIPLNKGIKGQLFFLLLAPYFFLKAYLGALIKYDKLLVFGPNNFDSLFLLSFRLAKKPSYLVVHDGVMHLGERNSLHQYILNMAMRLSYNHIFLTNYVSKMVKDKLGITRPSFILPHGPIIYGDVLEHPMNNQLELLVVGRLSFYKGLHIIRDLIPDLESIHCKLTLAGKISPEYKDLFTSSKFVQVDDRYLSDDDISNYVNRCDLILMPYVEATQSGIAALSIGYAKPAIISQVGGLPEQLDKDSSFHMETIDSNGIIRIIQDILSDNRIYYKKVEALKKLQDSVSWDKLSDLLIKKLNDIQQARPEN